MIAGDLNIVFQIVDASLEPFRRSAAIAKLSTSPDSQVALSFRIRADAITILLPTREECGVLDSRTASVLTVLIKKNPSLEFEAFLDPEQLQDSLGRLKPVSILPLCINIYGSTSSMEKVASVLSEKGVFLQEPIHVHPTSTYYNPHFLSWNADSKTPQLRQRLPRLADIEAGVQEILDPSDTVRVSDWPRQDGRILTVLHKSVFYGKRSMYHLLTLFPVVSHQLAAVQFMIAREDEYIGDETLSLWQRQWRLNREV